MSSPPGRDPAPPWIAHYPAHVPRDLRIPEAPLYSLLEQAAQRWPERTALIFYGRRWSYRDLWELSGHVAGNLTEAGFAPGDKFAIQLPNCPAYPAAYYGALRLGLSVVQVSPLYLGQDLSRVLQDSGAKGLLTLDILYPNLAAIRAQLPALAHVYVAHLAEFYPAWKRPLVGLALRRRKLPTRMPQPREALPWRVLLRPAGAPAVRIDPRSSVAVYQYTGGTTGRPKAAMLTHYNLLANALQCQAWFSLAPPGTAVTLASVPFFHVYGMTVALNFPVSEGSTIVLQLRPDVDEILRLIRRYHPTEFPGLPALYQAINVHPKVPTKAIRSIQVCVSGSAPLPLEVARQFEALTGGYLIEGYGLTEASPVTHVNPIQGQRKAGSIGIPLPLTDQRIVDLETGERTLPTGEVGELLVRGPQVMSGYAGQPEETARFLRDGWLYTGDIASVDAEGYAFIVDRKKDMVIVGGLKVYPREVEEVLYQHSQVAEAAVVGLPDPELGEVVVAIVAPKAGAAPTEAELIAFVRDRIAHYKAPRRVEFRPSLPRSAVQKVLRRTLREELLAARAAR
ncbi:MAG: long-chain fatty acid--CoA ligase [Thermoplasmata archaeon]|nr:long-chain fatty acid--CoA ligase [Thermoplasmata archaeon]MCI4341038.1 long-chain fatty acid--CoA ligase [Thermoplasmata archaeon]